MAKDYYFAIENYCDDNNIEEKIRKANSLVLLNKKCKNYIYFIISDDNLLLEKEASYKSFNIGNWYGNVYRRFIFNPEDTTYIVEEFYSNGNKVKEREIFFLTK